MIAALIFLFDRSSKLASLSALCLPSLRVSCDAAGGLRQVLP